MAKTALKIKENSAPTNLPPIFLVKDETDISENFDNAGLAEIESISAKTEKRYNGHLKTENALSRGLVSFQANKTRSVYRWYKFKEAFSADLVEYLLDRYKIKGGVLLDPFAGSGTALFASRDRKSVV